jgi:hypothetical protein
MLYSMVKRISKLIAEDIIAVDGKTLRGSKLVNECKKAILHIIAYREH